MSSSQQDSFRLCQWHHLICLKRGETLEFTCTTNRHNFFTRSTYHHFTPLSHEYTIFICTRTYRWKESQRCSFVLHKTSLHGDREWREMKWLFASSEKGKGPWQLRDEEFSSKRKLTSPRLSEKTRTDKVLTCHVVLKRDDNSMPCLDDIHTITNVENCALMCVMCFLSSL